MVAGSQMDSAMTDTAFTAFYEQSFHFQEQPWPAPEQPWQLQAAGSAQAATSAGAAAAAAAAAEAAREGPRGGKKPLRPQQQQVAALQAELERKTEEMRKAQEQREQLQQRIKVLEAVLPVRDQQLHWLRERKQQQQQQLTAPPPAGALDARWAPAGGDGIASAAASGSGASPSCSDTRSPHDYGAGRGLGAACSDGTPVTGSSRTPEAVIEAFRAMWNSWVREAGLLLHLHDARPHDPGPELRAGRLREGLLASLRPQRLAHSRLMLDVLDVNMETGACGEAPDDSFWVPVVKGLRLTAAQVADCKAALALYQERMARVLGERRRLAAQLDRCTRLQQEALRQQQAAAGPAPAPRGATLVEMEEVSLQLHHNVLAEGQATELVKDFLGSTLFNLMQSIRAAVLCYPHFPDAIAILNAIAATSPAALTAASAGQQ